jgi:hypothetical protein
MLGKAYKELWPDPRPEYMTPAEKVEQAHRLIPILEAEIAGGETRSIFTQLLAAQERILKSNGIRNIFE